MTTFDTLSSERIKFSLDYDINQVWYNILRSAVGKGVDSANQSSAVQVPVLEVFLLSYKIENDVLI